MPTHAHHTPQPPRQAPVPSSADPLKVRLVALMVFLASAGLLGVSAWLTPATQGLGTHEQLGLATCGLYAATGLPCATCGMTTSFALAADGRLVASFINQPAGAILAMLVAASAVGSLFTLITATPMLPLYSWLAKPKMLLLAALLVGLAWAYKVVATLGWIPGW